MASARVTRASFLLSGSPDWMHERSLRIQHRSSCCLTREPGHCGSPSSAIEHEQSAHDETNERVGESSFPH
eukprot:12292966-Alexandrium_andersonii.AAC.1